MNHNSRHQFAALAALTTLLLALAGCAIDPTTAPLLQRSTSGEKIQLNIEFANVLNLPRGAKVIANGVEVGSLTQVTIHEPDADGNGFVVAKVEVQASSSLPMNTNAELRQETPLGDIHISLSSPPGAREGPLRDGDTIPLSRTTASPQVEDLLAGLATMVTGGAVTDFQDIVRQLNTALPQDPSETAYIFDILKADLVDVSNNLQTVDSVLNGITENVNLATRQSDKIEALLSDYGVTHVTEVVRSVVQVLFLLSNLGPLAHNAVWLAPLIQSLDDTAAAVVPVLWQGSPLDVSVPSNLTKLVELIEDKIIPFVELGPKFDVVSAHTDSSLSTQDQTIRIVQTLRMIGVVR